MRDTSLAAFELIKPKIGRRQNQVLKAVYDNPGITRQGVSHILRLPINCVTGRVCELLSKKLIIESGIVNKQHRLYPAGF
jgi:predicted transcriptional regulator